MLRKSTLSKSDKKKRTPKQRVSPMISGHTITPAKINLTPIDHVVTQMNATNANTAASNITLVPIN